MHQGIKRNERNVGLFTTIVSKLHWVWRC